MEKQRALFQTEENDDSSIQDNLPEENREKIEALFATLLIRYLSSLSEEVTAHEKP
jgi:hypothetical protein